MFSFIPRISQVILLLTRFDIYLGLCTTHSTVFLKQFYHKQYHHHIRQPLKWKDSLSHSHSLYLIFSFFRKENENFTEGPKLHTIECNNSQFHHIDTDISVVTDYGLLFSFYLPLFPILNLFFPSLRCL